MRRVIASFVLLVAPVCVAALFLADTAQAQTIRLSFTTDPDVGISGKPGDLYHVAGGTVPAELQGVDCWVTADVRNNTSVRPGTWLEVSSGGVSVVLNPTAGLGGVEGVPGDAPPADLGTLKLGQYVNVWVGFGPKGEASVDADVHVNCPDAPPPPPDVPQCMVEPPCDDTPVVPPHDPIFTYGPGVPQAVIATPEFTG